MKDIWIERDAETLTKSILIILVVVLVSACSGRNREDQPPFLEKTGVCTSLDNHALLADIGFDFIEENLQRFIIPFESHEVFSENLERLEASSLPVLALNVFIPGHLKSVGPEAAHPEIIAYADTAFRRAQMAGVESIVFGSGGSRRIPEGFDPELAKMQFVDLLKQMGPVAEEYGVYVVVEPLHRGEVNFINTVVEGLEIVKMADHPHIRLLCDFFHMLREDEPADHILMAAGYVHHVHIAERDNRTAPGIAGDDFRPYLRALKEIGYAGHISIEASWSDFETELPIAIAALQQQIEDVRAGR